jgi:hypothetical protein
MPSDDRWTRFYAVSAEAVEAGLHAVVPGGAEVWNWLPQKPEGGPSDTAKEIVRALLADALSAAVRSEGVKVRALEWEHVSGNIWDARSPIGGLYRVRRDADGDWNAFLYGSAFKAVRSTEAEAKSAAQEHYTNAVLSAITSPVQTREDGMERALRNIAEGNLGDAPWQANYDKIRAVAREALLSQPEPRGDKA